MLPEPRFWSAKMPTRTVDRSRRAGVPTLNNSFPGQMWLGARPPQSALVACEKSMSRTCFCVGSNGCFSRSLLPRKARSWYPTSSASLYLSDTCQVLPVHVLKQGELFDVRDEVESELRHARVPTQRHRHVGCPRRQGHYWRDRAHRSTHRHRHLRRRKEDLEAALRRRPPKKSLKRRQVVERMIGHRRPAACWTGSASRARWPTRCAQSRAGLGTT